MKKFIILIPLFNDWKSVSRLLKEIDLQVNNWKAEISIFIVNDASTEKRSGLEFNFKKIKYFFSILLILFILSPATYLYVSISQKDKRTDYPGREIAKIVQEKWDNNFKGEIKSVIGDEWHAGDLSYHLKSNPKWHSHSNAFVEKTVDEFIDTIGKDGFIIVNGECSTGVSFVIKNNNICMNSKK